MSWTRGLGLPAEKLATIFEPFAQADGSISRRYGGTGLGLSISTRLVALMGGALTVDSVQGQGSTFSFWLPIVVRSRRPTSCQPELARGQARAPTAAACWSSKTIP